MGKLEEWKKEVIQHKSLIWISLVFLLIAIILNYAAGEYVEDIGTVAVPDIILDHIPIINLTLLFTWGIAIVIILIFAYPLLYKVKELHIAISQFSLLVLIRSFFITLTHLKAPAGAIIINSRLLGFLDFQNALFFSGHTSIPFLGFLLFRKEKIGIFFLIATIIMALTVLFMHVHYSIDVFAALFITYGSYKIGNWLFSKINHKK